MIEQRILPATNDHREPSSTARDEIAKRGAVFTRPEVVEFILDLAGYTVDRPLCDFRILEPSSGYGDFLVPIVERLLVAYHNHRESHSGLVPALSSAVRAVELDGESIGHARRRLAAVLLAHGINGSDTEQLLDSWLIRDDFLLTELPEGFTHVIGNPPYVRQERIPALLKEKYRSRYRTLFDRADLYVPFIERCLCSLAPGGVLGFICSDRWMKNKYGGPLRAMVAQDYHIAAYIDMVDTPAFQSDVIAYPAITVIRREEPGPTRVARRPSIDRDTLTELSRAITADCISPATGVVEVTDVANGGEPWVLHSFESLGVVRRLEASFPTLEQVGCTVGIGVATGADRVYIRPYETLDVEPDRKLPLVMTRDIESGRVEWRGFGVINPFNGDGTLVNLTEYPKLARYFAEHADAIRKRHCAEKNPPGWYRTIDRIHPALTGRPKLLIPDIKGDAHVVYEDGQYYPHHNLYYITSDDWDLHSLLAVLRSGIARLFVEAYSTQMRGGYLRFQAQYLRKIRLPYWHEVPGSIRRALHEAAVSEDAAACKEAVCGLFQLTSDEEALLYRTHIEESV